MAKSASLSAATARYEHLPIWTTAMQLAAHLERAGARFRCWSQLAAFERQCRLDASGGGWRIPVSALDALRARLASYLGHFRHADAGRLWARLLRRFAWLDEVFLSVAAALEHGLLPRWRLPREQAAPSLRQQLRAFAERLPPNTRLLVEVGNRWCCLPAVVSASAARVLPRQRGVIPSLWLAAVDDAQLTLKQARLQCRQWRAAPSPFAVIAQTGFQKDGRRARVLVQLWMPNYVINRSKFHEHTSPDRADNPAGWHRQGRAGANLPAE